MTSETAPSTNMDLDKTTITSVQNKILSFYDEHGRDLPWRQTQDPYNVWVSEVMLQQTQVSRVIPKYESWTDRYPDVHDAANASFADILELWEGLGYNNRAKWLHDACQQVLDEHDGALPRSADELQSLPGVGPYTARAIKIFAYNDDVVTVDTNIRRVLISELGLSESLEEDDLYDVAEQLLPEGRSREWHNALMDYGAQEATSAATGISPTSTQSAFDGSVRQARGEILRRLQNGPVTRDALNDAFPNRGEDAAQGLIDDGLVVEENDELRLV